MVKSYIASKTYFKTIAENDFEKDSNKFLSKSVYRISIQSVRNERDIRIFTNEKNEKQKCSLNTL